MKYFISYVVTLNMKSEKITVFKNCCIPTKKPIDDNFISDFQMMMADDYAPDEDAKITVLWFYEL